MNTRPHYLPSHAGQEAIVRTGHGTTDWFKIGKGVQLCDSLNIPWHRLSLGLEWELTFSSPVATAEFSRFADILSVALSQNLK